MLHLKTFNNKGDLDDLSHFEDEEDVVTVVCPVVVVEHNTERRMN